MKEGYKVLHSTFDGRLWSPCAEYQVEYRIAERTVPMEGFGPLCVFKTFSDAREFVELINELLTVWRCDYEPSADLPWMLLPGKPVEPPVKKSIVPYLIADGADFAGSVTIKEKVG